MILIINFIGTNVYLDIISLRKSHVKDFCKIILVEASYIIEIDLKVVIY